MKLLRHYEDAPADVRGAVVALGNFDGVHLGHRAVIGQARALANDLGRPAAVMTFEPHPRSFFRPNDPPFRLTPLRIKTRLVAALGVDALVVLHFDAALSGMTAEEFVEKVLVQGLGVHHVVAGYDFLFGHNRGGDMDLLRALGGQHGFGVTEARPVANGAGEPYSSTAARRHLQEGRPQEATAILGHPFEIEGRVEHGDKRGRTIGFPTANIEIHDYLRPQFGVYAVRAGVDEGAATVWHDGVANLGRRPTVGGTVERLEAHLFDFDGDLYGRHVRVQVLDFIRPEMKFESFQALKDQIVSDADEARRRLAALPKP
ncbi:bifunctional riboflavin kinase/FAD synthetase [Nitrospirillum sp. BR 11828]|uniref:bifunctional riboflavin kinase/FAD synthetase n=1 Tax=Nitrospirillum sp. BR 11828 TaxID=3104325 RepID=UPI002ACA1765|nr:bifunctional riboflavin kinase/FAD synthetase [Nitrospirillum sp. BR 11828]MDZ5646233.1 bifunctional riboflavin kinase/FAD synthetase [Nitrospirillum sp. BR 11828]